MQQKLDLRQNSECLEHKFYLSPEIFTQPPVAIVVKFRMLAHRPTTRSPLITNLALPTVSHSASLPDSSPGLPPGFPLALLHSPPLVPPPVLTSAYSPSPPSVDPPAPAGPS